MFAKDRDVLALEPNAFRDLLWAAQAVLTGKASTLDTSLEVSDTTTDLQQAGVTAGHVIVVAGVPMEIVSIDGSTEATVSLLRALESDPPIPPPKFNEQACLVMTFRPQLELTHRMVLRMAGIDPDAAGAPGVLTQDAITNPGALRRLEALGALHLLWSAAGATLSEHSPANERARMYRQRFDAERQRVAVEIDLDADARPDALRRLNAMLLTRV